MNVTIVLPCSGRRPSGGFRILYEHANRLARRGHKVTLIHISASSGNLPLAKKARALVRFVKDKMFRTYRPAGWFSLDEEVQTRLILNPSPDALPKGDAVIASAWETASMVASAPAWCGRRFYFIQSYEDWSGPADEVRATWRMPMEKLVIAKWLEDIAGELGEESAFVPNAVDHTFFRRKTPVSDRGAATILFQSMERELKGSADAVTAIESLRNQGLELEVIAFGRVDPARFGLSQPYEFHYDPAQAELVELYNRAAVYITASHIEGWSLTLAEAAACGAALIASDIGGHRDLAIPGRNAKLFPVKDTHSLAMAIRELVLDIPARYLLAEQSWSDVQAFNWEVASDRFEAALIHGIKGLPPLSSRALIEGRQSDVHEPGSGKNARQAG